jgi:hypothetical protein
MCLGSSSTCGGSGDQTSVGVHNHDHVQAYTSHDAGCSRIAEHGGLSCGRNG